MKWTPTDKLCSSRVPKNRGGKPRILKLMVKGPDGRLQTPGLEEGAKVVPDEVALLHRRPAATGIGNRAELRLGLNGDGVDLNPLATVGLKEPNKVFGMV